MSSVDDATAIAVALDGVPLMSPACWSAVERALLERPSCRYLEWGTGNSTIAALRVLLGRGELDGARITAVEHDRRFADAMVQALAATFAAAGREATITVEPLPPARPTLLAALRPDGQVRRYGSELLPVLWDSRNDAFWISSAVVPPEHRGRVGRLRRRVLLWRCRAAHRADRVRRATRPPVAVAPVAAGTAREPSIPPLRGATRVRFVAGDLQLDYLHLPALRNRLWRGAPILDGVYEEFAHYVTGPPAGPYDVVLVDGRARVSCLKRVHHEQLVAPGGQLLLHDAHRPFQLEALRLFEPSVWIRGGDATPFDREMFVYRHGDE